MKRSMPRTLAAASLLFCAAILAPAFGQSIAPAGTSVTPNTACGSLGTGRDTLHQVVTMQMPGNRVNAQGAWESCDRPCPSVESPPSWSASGLQCSSSVADPGAVHGQARVFVSDGRYRGTYVYRCSDGGRVQVLASCWDVHAGTCVDDAAVSELRPNRQKRWYYYDARLAPVPEGGVVTARSLDGRSMPLICRGGRLVQGAGA